MSTASACRRFALPGLLALLLGAAAPTATAEVSTKPSANLPLLELGLGVGSVRFAYYPGSAEYRTITAPLPTVVLRDKVLRAGDEQGLRAVLEERPSRGVDLSFGGSWQVDSDDVEARSGMPDLDWTFQLGPRFYWRLKQQGQNRLMLYAPIRAAFSTDFSDITDRGVLLAPQLRLQHGREGVQGHFAAVSLSSRFATRRWHDYFYGVADAYATDQRPAYDADGGYVDSTVAGIVGKRRGRLGLVGSISYSSLAGSASQDSPLLVRDYDWSVAAGVTWMFYASRERGYPEQPVELQQARTLPSIQAPN